MEFLQSLHLILSISTLFSVLVMKMKDNLVCAGPTGLTLKLIHIDSPESPLYPGNLTREERIRRDFHRSKAHHQQLKASINSWRVRNYYNDSGSSSSLISHPDIARPPLSYSHETYFYMVKLGLGTFPTYPGFKEYFFILDSASDLLWLQCQGCSPCYPQVGDDYYPAGRSSTYQRRSQTYHVTYADEASTSGVMAIERLVVNSDNGQLEQIRNIVIGCGMSQQNFDYGDDDQGHPRKTEIAGMMGLGGGYNSFLRQLGRRGYEEKFAYCFELWTHNTGSTYLQFGSDANIQGGRQVAVHTTPLLFERGPTVYYVHLHDISIAGIPVGYPQADLITQADGTGGCIFDSGTPFTLLSKSVYSRLEDHLIQYFSQLNVHTTDDTDVYDTCFTKPNGFNGYPTITFHFLLGAYLEVQPEAAFYITDDIFCLAIVGDTNQEPGEGGPAVTIGAIQQANHKVLYDIGNYEISWAREECGSHS